MKAGHRVYAIGDVHGRYDLLSDLIYRLSAEQRSLEPARTHIVLIGDLIDRGPRSAEVLKLARWATVNEPRGVVLKGNHEELLVEAWRGDLEALAGWLEHGGVETLESFGIDRAALDPAEPERVLARLRAAVPADIIEWLDTLPLTWRLGDYAFVHAGVRPGLPLDRQEEVDLLWIREEFLEFDGAHDQVIVHGHTITDEVEIRHNRIAIDTGAYRTGKLSAICLWEQEQRVISTSDDVLELTVVVGADGETDSPA